VESRITMTNRAELAKLADKLIREEKMPSLETLRAEILRTRRKFANEIRRARREAHQPKD
jgi:hypothetical protein